MIVQLLFARQNLRGALKTATRGARCLSLGIRLADPTSLDKALKLAEPLALASGVNAVLATRIEGLVIYQFELNPGMWEYYTRQDVIGLAIGLADQRRPVEFALDPPHALIAGTTGSGKSETLKSILVALVQNHGVSDLGLVLIDPHRELDDFNNEAHLIMPIAHNAEEIKNAFAWANQELAHRKAGNVRDGQTIVIAIDEATADEVLADGANLEIAKSISSQARKYRMHVILATQKPAHSDLPGILDKLLNRWIGQLSDARTSATVTGHAGLQAHKLTPKGDFLHIAGPDVQRFQVAMATRQDFDRLERAEIKSITPLRVQSLNSDFYPLPAVLPSPDIGRPPIELDPELLAFYFFHHPDKITHRMADEILGLKRTGHVLHRDFCNSFIEAYLKLRKEGQRLGA